MSRYVISSKVIARDLERNRDPKTRWFYPGKIIALVLLNLLLWILIFTIATRLNLI